MNRDPEIIVDGYNLMHWLFARRILDVSGGLERGRRGVLARIAELVPDDQQSKIVVVFDAGEGAPAGIREDHSGQGRGTGPAVRFATGHAEADTLIEEMIARHSAPAQLTVVSGDRRLKDAARRRGARGLDCGAWIDELEQAGQAVAGEETRARPSDRPGTVSPEERAEWMRRFGFGNAAGDQSGA